MDWADKEPDNDLTKNYPFPVPRIRDLSSEFRTECCNLHSHSVPSAEEMSQNAAAANTEDAVLLDAVPLQNFAEINATGSSSSHTSSNDEEAKSRRRRLSHISSDSKLVTLRRTKPAHHKDFSHSLNIPSEYHCTSHSRFLYGSVVKSIVEEPPDASKEEVDKARQKFKK